MYAHQVIENLSSLKIIPSNPDYEKAVEYVVWALRERAVCFSLGDMNINKESEIFKPVDGRPLFRKPEKLLRLPYEVTFVDWMYKSPNTQRTKGGFLAIQHVEDSGKPCIQVFILGNEQDGHDFTKLIWTLHPAIYTISENDDIRGTKIIPHGDGIGPQFEFTMLDRFLKFLNCKNIGTIDNEPPVKLNKSRVKKGKQPIFTYKTLVIKPTGKRQQSLAAQGLWENRIHLCRGHFKEYTADKPLFGRFAGRYWWQPSVRGRNTQGVVMKDYEVKNGQAESACG